MNFENIKKITELLQNKKDTVSADLVQTLEQATNLLSEAYGIDNQDGEAAAAKGAENNIYEFAYNKINAEFDRLFNEIENNRSSYMPYGLYKEVLKYSSEEVSKSAEVLNGITTIESPQNAFYRMVGLPSSEDLEVSYKLPIINTSGELKNNVININNIYSFLDLRQAAYSVGCSNSISPYNIYNQRSSETILKEGYRFSTDQYDSVINMSDRVGALITSNKENYSTNFVGVMEEISKYKSDTIILKKEDDGINPTLFDQIISDMIGMSFEDGTEYISNNLFLFYGSFLTFIYLTGNSENNQDDAPSISDISFLLNDLVLKKEVDETVNNIENIFFNYSSFLFPMVQDGRIARCINDPEKIIAEPFLPKSKRVVNGKGLRSSLLETIIRIRSDVNSGTKKYMFEDFVISNNSNIVTNEDLSASTLGYIESLLIIRMLDSLALLAKNVRNSIHTISKSQRKNKISLYSSCGKRNSKPTSASGLDKPGGAGGGAGGGGEENSLNAMLLIEDSLMLVLGTGEEQGVVDLQVGTARNSSISNSALMPSLLNVAQVPRNYINNRISEIKKDRKINTSTGTKSHGEIETAIGIVGGVGMVDFIVISLSLLTIQEASLLSLLNKKQRESMFNELTTLSGFKKKVDETTVYKSVEKLTEIAHSYYNIFIDLLKNI